MTSKTPVHVFAGPSLFGTPYQDDEPDTLNGSLIWHPPARRGDIAALLNEHTEPGIIALADGTFHSYPSVAHVELRQAMERGWLVYGLCSMGAIRACEMRHLGMRPFGYVAQLFCDDAEMADDEVALVHATDAPYMPFSEPMVHIRAYLQDMLSKGLLTSVQHVEAVTHIRERWYAERTLNLLRDTLTRLASPETLDALLESLLNFNEYRLKQRDLVTFLQEKPWTHDIVDTSYSPPTLMAALKGTPMADCGNEPHTGATVALSSSLRSRTAEESLALARPLALERGISRVVDTTWLDRLGIPVYASIRPNAANNSLCVHAGKGRFHSEAKIGAYMEAIEFSFAEFGRNDAPVHQATPLEILDSFDNRIHFTEFCPAQQQSREVREDDLIGVVQAEELLSLQRQVLVPAELIYHPYTGPGLKLYGTNTNGLASGNNIEEATVHGLAEVMERHADSFVKLGAPTYWVDPQTLPPAVRAMVDRIEAAGMQLHLRYAPNDFGLPFLSAFLLEDDDSPAAMATGMGFHCNSSIAAVRAISEAAQSRLTTIHGGRDDLVTLHMRFNQLGPEKERLVKAHVRLAVADRSRVISFADIPDIQAQTIQAAHAALVAGLRRAGLNFLTRVVLTSPSCPFQVVHVVVPGAEYYNHDHKRIGPRVLEYAKNKLKRSQPGA
jgi:ribosomal protein S12 methylthiotransferase accessory factor